METTEKNGVLSGSCCGYIDIPGSKMETGERNDALGRPGFLELIYGILFNPVPTFCRIRELPPLGQAALIFFILALSNGILSFSFFRSAFSNLPGADFAAVAPALSGLFPFVIFFALVFSGLKWFLNGAVLHFLAELWGGTGTPKGTLTVYALAGLPGIFLVVAELLLRLLRIPEIAAAVLSSVVGLGILVWGIVLLVLGLRETHNFSTGAAVLTVLTPLAVLILLAIGLGVAVVVLAGVLFPLLHPS